MRANAAVLLPADCLHVCLHQELSEKNEEQEKESGSSQNGAGNSHRAGETAEDKGERGETGPKDSCYEFNLTETTILEVVMDSMRTCGLALALQALSTLLLGTNDLIQINLVKTLKLLFASFVGFCM